MPTRFAAKNNRLLSRCCIIRLLNNTVANFTSFLDLHLVLKKLKLKTLFFQIESWPVADGSVELGAM